LKLKLLITGTGHCGTGYVAKLLTDAGYVCGHEYLYRWKGFCPQDVPPWGFSPGVNWCAESSWPAAGFLNDERLKDTRIVHLVRSPRHVLRSLMPPPPYSGTNVNLTASRIIAWNELVEEHADIRVRVESRRDILRQLELNVAGSFDDNRYNRHCKDDNYPTWDALPNTAQVARLRRMAERYGYEE
jgi:hypothetical protein